MSFSSYDHEVEDLHEAIFDKYTLLDYATQNWLYHLRNGHRGTSPDQKTSEEKAVSLLQERYDSSLVLQNLLYLILDDLLYGKLYQGGTGKRGKSHRLRDNSRDDDWTYHFLYLEPHLRSWISNTFSAGSWITRKSANAEYSLIHIFACTGLTSGFRLLIESSDTNINLQDIQGRTPLSIAVKRGYDKIFGILLDKDGIKIDRKGSYGLTPLMVATRSEFDNSEAFRLLLQKSTSVEGNQIFNSIEWMPLISATEFGNTGIIRFLLEREDIELESKTTAGRTALALACKNCDVDTVQLFLGKGAELESLDNDGQTPLFRAVEAGNVGVVKALLKAGAVVDVADNSGRTPLSIAAHRQEKEVVQALIERGADVNTKDTEGLTPLIWFLKEPFYSNRDCFEFLLAQKDIDVNWKAKDGSTALSTAFRNRKDYINNFHIPTLRAHGADEEEDDEELLEWEENGHVPNEVEDREM
jgi:ankyrin repeat protein